MSVLSPLTNKKALKIKSISVNELNKHYMDSFKIDISRFFNDLNSIYIYKCLETGYHFYYPFNISGDGNFYEKLQEFDWYYMPWKWENEITLKFLKGNEKILEVGSGGLGFIENLASRDFDITGLELNEDSVSKAKGKGLRVLNETIQDHSLTNENEYDVVCSYQVLEHISEVHSFIEAQYRCLKKGGKLIISVPNNDSFIKYSEGGLLNRPPHHMGLWNQESLLKIASIFDLKVYKILKEPLQDYHINWYLDTIREEKISKNRYLNFFFRKLRLNNLLEKIIHNFKNRINGHSIMIIYTKI